MKKVTCSTLSTNKNIFSQGTLNAVPKNKAYLQHHILNKRVQVLHPPFNANGPRSSRPCCDVEVAPFFRYTFRGLNLEMAWLTTPD